MESSELDSGQKLGKREKESIDQEHYEQHDEKSLSRDVSHQQEAREKKNSFEKSMSTRSPQVAAYGRQLNYADKERSRNNLCDQCKSTRGATQTSSQQDQIQLLQKLLKIAQESIDSLFAV
ncbi:hypothetical protein CBS101457_004609 [Exobasidium rhododendri]|nr:hypothetical protein CBS101457_004609 [Exobasidium rhododendri]